MAPTSVLLFADAAAANARRDNGKAKLLFYQRVSFTCRGKLINGWAMLHPAKGRRTYAAAVEAITRTYKSGAGRMGYCDE
jgi:hypothetical protein